MVKVKFPDKHSHFRLWLWSVFDGGKTALQIDNRVKMLLSEAYAAAETHIAAHEDALKTAYEDVSPSVVWLQNHGSNEIDVEGTDAECSRAKKVNKLIISSKAKLITFQEKWNTERAVVLKTIDSIVESKVTEVCVYLAGQAGKMVRKDMDPDAEAKNYLDSISEELTDFHNKLLKNIDELLK